MHVPARTALGVAALVIASGAIVSACSTQDSADGPATQHPLPTPTTGTATALADEMAQRQAVDAYRAMWKVVADAATTSDWRSPALARHATGDALSVLSRQLYADHYNGLVSRGAPVNNPVVDSVKAEDPLTAIRIRDCSDATGWLKYRADTGQPADSSPGGRHLINAEVRLSVDSAWRVTRFAVGETGSC
jgi:hypothetical protein